MTVQNLTLAQLRATHQHRQLHQVKPQPLQYRVLTNIVYRPTYRHLVHMMVHIILRVLTTVSYILQAEPNQVIFSLTTYLGA